MLFIVFLCKSTLKNYCLLICLFGLYCLSKPDVFLCDMAFFSALFHPCLYTKISISLSLREVLKLYIDNKYSTLT